MSSNDNAVRIEGEAFNQVKVKLDRLRSKVKETEELMKRLHDEAWEEIKRNCGEQFGKDQLLKIDPSHENDGYYLITARNSVQEIVNDALRGAIPGYKSNED